MMNHFFWLKIATNLLLHNQSMFQDVSYASMSFARMWMIFWGQNPHIPIWACSAPAFPMRIFRTAL